jgi:hypothetical protein
MIEGGDWGRERTPIIANKNLIFILIRAHSRSFAGRSLFPLINGNLG